MLRSTRRATRVRPLLAGPLAIAIAVPLTGLPASPAVAADTPAPTSVTIAGSLQGELGCPGDWQPECAVTHLDFDDVDGVWQASFDLPAGSWEYKAALNGTWDENYGLGGVRNGPNVPVTLAEARSVRFYYDHETHWVTDNVGSVIATAPGSFQSELGCSGDWQPDCLRSWLQDPDGDGTYSFSTTAIPAGSYESKVAIDEGWDLNYGAGGAPNGPNLAFDVPADGATVTFTWDASTKEPAVSVTTGGLEPGDADLVRDPVRQAGSDEFIYFVMTDRFANGDPANDRGGSTSSDRMVHGFDPTDKGFYHGGDLAGLQARLDYLQGMGVTALWITPPFENNWVQGSGDDISAGYHGYWQVDLTTIDPHLGSNAEMKDLIADAHARGMKVYFDVVANHTGDVVQYVGGDTRYRSKDDYPYRDADGTVFDDRDFAGGDTFPTLDPDVSFPYVPTFADPADEDRKSPAFLNDRTLYHNRGNSTFTGENSLYGDFYGLDDLFTEHPEVVSGMTAAHQAMITEFGIDGFRVDTVKHVNDEFWEAFVPAIRAHAKDEGKDDFVVFGEVFSGDPEYASRFSTELPFPATLDFRFDETVKATIASSGPTQSLAKLFSDDDWFTDDDSNGSSLVKFAGNHDRGRIGYELQQANPGASDAELVARATLVQALNFTTRGVPIVYYGDEQGFTGDGGDKDARQDMFPSQVASYNDDDLIGTDATTADDNFDTTHPLYRAIGDLAGLRAAHPTLRSGAQLNRHSTDGPGIYAFSRIDRDEKTEYVVAVNTSESQATATFPTDSPGTSFTQVYPGAGAGPAADADGSITVTVPALGAVVHRADATIPVTGPHSVSMTAPAAGAEVAGRTLVSAAVTPARHAEVTFAAKVGDGQYRILGTDDSAPYSVRHDVSGIAAGTAVSYKAIVTDLAGTLSSAKVGATVAADEPPATGRPYAVVHYLRTDGDYGDTSSEDSNDFWGLHAWGDIDETIEWTAPKQFIGEDEYGRFAWLKLTPGASNVGFIVHRGDTKDGTDADRFFDPSKTPQIWLRQGDPTIHTSQAAAQGFATVHYQRPDGQYDGWGLHLWGDAIADGVGTEWASPRPRDGVDEFGAYWNVPLEDATKPVNFIIHKGDEKDPGPDQSFVPAEDASTWVMSGDETLHAERGGALGLATLHYHRPDGDYGDSTSTDFNDFWGLHTWGDAADPGWTTPRKPTRFDAFGPVFEVPLVNDRTEFGYLFHRGDSKDPGPDQSLDVKDVGYEVWQLQAADPEDPYLLPMPPAGPVSRGNLDEERAYWVDRDTILWAAADDPKAQYRLHHAADGGLQLTDAGVSGDSLVLTPGTASAAVRAKFPHLKDLPALKIAADDLDEAPAILTGQVAVAASAGGTRLDATGLQLPGVLDDLYATDAELGVSWTQEIPTVALWAPTAKSVTLLRYDDSADTEATETPMVAADGVWSVRGDSGWAGQQYLFDVEVYVPSTGEVEHNLVTDPYSLALSTNSARSMFVDLADPDLAPEGWDSVAKPELVAPEDISLYELHVRDFSASDPKVPDPTKGTFQAFALEETFGTDHLEALADAGLTHVHLLPAFDIATVDEDRATWQQPDPAALAAMAPDSEQQQAAVSATADADGFNWGYDPWHYTVPEGSYSTDPEGTARILEFRDMVAALNADGLRVVMDVVYNHTTAAGQDPKSVLDRVVPGYYHRLDDKGSVETSTCCSNTASEHAMMEKLMIDSLVTWARDYRVDGFRFDLMGHHSKQNMLNVRAALDELTLAEDGVDGRAIYLYGEGWNFGEVANDARFVQATQANLAGTGIGTFNDRLRDAVRGGGPFDDKDNLVLNQGLVNGLWYDPNELVEDKGPTARTQRDRLLLSADQVRVGLAGNLADYEFIDRNGDLVTGSQVDYNGSPAGYTDDPQENIVYVEAHDNQTLFDISQYKHPLSAPMADRVRAQNLGMDLTVLAQGVPFVHAGMELLRSKSMDRDSYNSGDWFNTLDFTNQSNTWGAGLPVAGKNQDNWYLIGPRLADPDLKPAPADIRAADAHLAEMLQVRESSPLFRLRTAEQIAQRLAFANTGPDQVPGLVVMTLADPVRDPLQGGDLDEDADGLVVLFNATDEPVTYALADAKGADMALHPVLAGSSDPVVRTAAFAPEDGSFTVPARTTAVFVEAPEDVVAPTVGADLVPIQVGAKQGRFRVLATCTDDSSERCLIEADVNGVPVEDGDVVQLVVTPGRQRVTRVPGTGTVRIMAPAFTLTVTCTDPSGNAASAEVQPVFRIPGRPS